MPETITTQPPTVTVKPSAWAVTVDGRYAGTVNDYTFGGVPKFYAVALHYGNDAATLDEAAAALVAHYTDPDPDRELLAAMTRSLGGAAEARAALRAYRTAVAA